MFNVEKVHQKEATGAIVAFEVAVISEEVRGGVIKRMKFRLKSKLAMNLIIGHYVGVVL